MDSLLTSPTSKAVLWRNVILCTLWLYVGAVLTSVCAALPRLRALPIGEARDIVCGPLALIHINKTALPGDAFELGLAFQSGLIVLLAVCLVVSVAIVLVLQRLGRRQ